MFLRRDQNRYVSLSERWSHAFSFHCNALLQRMLIAFFFYIFLLTLWYYFFFVIIIAELSPVVKAWGFSLLSIMSCIILNFLPLVGSIYLLLFFPLVGLFLINFWVQCFHRYLWLAKTYTSDEKSIITVPEIYYDI